MILYIDGMQAGTGGGAQSSYGNSGFGFNIGGAGIWDATGNSFSGNIDDVRLYDKALTQSEIIQTMRGDPKQAWGPDPSSGRVVDVPRVEGECQVLTLTTG